MNCPYCGQTFSQSYYEKTHVPCPENRREGWEEKAHREAEAHRGNAFATIRVPGGEVLASAHLLPYGEFEKRYGYRP